MRCCLDKGRCLNLRGTVYSEFHAAPLTSTQAFLLCWWWWWCYILHKTPPHADFFMLSALMAVSQWVGLTHKATLKERNSPLLLPLSLTVLSDQGCQTLKLDNWVKRKKKNLAMTPMVKGTEVTYTVLQVMLGFEDDNLQKAFVQLCESGIKNN